MRNESVKVVGVNVSTGEKKEYPSINAAAREIGSSYQGIQIALLRNGVVKGWRMYENADAIRKRIAELKERLKAIQ